MAGHGTFEPGGSTNLIGPDGRPVNDSYLASDGFALPHVLSYASIFNAAQKTYWHDRWDDAMRFSRESALVMRRDAYLMALLQERKLAVASLNWHLEVPNDKDPRQVQVRDHLTRQLRGCPFFHRVTFALLEALWYGRYGVQFQYDWEYINGIRSLTLQDWMPVNGDKIGHHWSGLPYILAHVESKDIPGAEITHTTRGWGVTLSGGWRERFVIHKHEIDDADYFDAEKAEGVHGVGLRHRLFWLDWLEREYLEWIVTYMERVGLGLTIWYYEAGNKQSRLEVEQAAREQSNRTNIVWPRSSDGKHGSGIERIETPQNGAELLLKMRDTIREDKQRYVMGQSLSSGTEGSGLGGNNVARLHESTKSKIIAFDAKNLAQTLTGHAADPGPVWMMQRWTFPETLPSRRNPNGFRVQLVYDVDMPDPDKRLQAAHTVWSMGASVKENEVVGMAGLTPIGEGSRILKNPQFNQPAPGQGMAGGMPPDVASGMAAGAAPSQPPGASSSPAPAGSGVAPAATPSTEDFMAALQKLEREEDVVKLVGGEEIPEQLARIVLSGKTPMWDKNNECWQEQVA